MGVVHYLDTILVPLSLFATLGYHAYLWYNFKKKPCTTTIGINSIKRRIWLKEMKQGNDTHGMLAVQSLRNALMATILTGTITILITLALAALTNNTYKINNLLDTTFFGVQTNKLLLLKYGSTSIFLLASFLCSSMALANLIDANYLIYALGGSGSGSGSETSSSMSMSSSSLCAGHTLTVMERGFVLGVVGTRVLCIAFSLLMWMVGPVMVALSSVVLVSGFYMIDFAGAITIA